MEIKVLGKGLVLKWACWQWAHCLLHFSILAWGFMVVPVICRLTPVLYSPGPQASVLAAGCLCSSMSLGSMPCLIFFRSTPGGCGMDLLVCGETQTDHAQDHLNFPHTQAFIGISLPPNRGNNTTQKKQNKTRTKQKSLRKCGSKCS